MGGSGAAAPAQEGSGLGEEGLGAAKGGFMEEGGAPPPETLRETELVRYQHSYDHHHRKHTW